MSVVFAEPKACAMDDHHIATQEAIFLRGKTTTVAHVNHFFEDGSTGTMKTADYDENMLKLALAHGKGEGWGEGGTNGRL